MVKSKVSSCKFNFGLKMGWHRYNDKKVPSTSSYG